MDTACPHNSRIQKAETGDPQNKLSGHMIWNVKLCIFGGRGEIAWLSVERIPRNLSWISKNSRNFPMLASSLHAHMHPCAKAPAQITPHMWTCTHLYTICRHKKKRLVLFFFKKKNPWDFQLIWNKIPPAPLSLNKWLAFTHWLEPDITLPLPFTEFLHPGASFCYFLLLLLPSHASGAPLFPSFFKHLSPKI